MRASRILGAVAVLAVLTGTVGCGTPKDEPTRAGGVTVEASNGTVTVPAKPERIVSLAPTHTETLFAIGAGAQVVAVDELSDYPTNAPRTQLSGFTPNAEAIIDYQPDLVVLSDDQNGIVEALEKVNIPVLQESAPKDLDGAYDEIADLGKATGHTAEADRLIASMRDRIARATADRPRTARPLTYFHELDPQLDTVTSATFIGQVYQRFGLVNVADAADKTGTGYPKFSREALLQADPDLIFLADTRCCGQNADVVAQRPGWSELRAVRAHLVTTLDDDVASRWGPRLPELFEAVGRAVHAAVSL